jgi:ATP-dependent Lon protease
VLRLSNEIGQQTRAAFDERQREAILREQMATIQRQLGEGDGKAQEVTELNAAIANAKMPPEAESQARRNCAATSGCRKPQPKPAWCAIISDWLTICPGASDKSPSISHRPGACS